MMLEIINNNLQNPKKITIYNFYIYLTCPTSSTESRWIRKSSSSSSSSSSSAADNVMVGPLVPF